MYGAPRARPPPRNAPRPKSLMSEHLLGSHLPKRCPRPRAGGQGRLWVILGGINVGSTHGTGGSAGLARPQAKRGAKVTKKRPRVAHGGRVPRRWVTGTRLPGRARHVTRCDGMGGTGGVGVGGGDQSCESPPFPCATLRPGLCLLRMLGAIKPGSGGAGGGGKRGVGAGGGGGGTACGRRSGGTRVCRGRAGGSRGQASGASRRVRVCKRSACEEARACKGAAAHGGWCHTCARATGARGSFARAGGGAEARSPGTHAWGGGGAAPRVRARRPRVCEATRPPATVTVPAPNHVTGHTLGWVAASRHPVPVPAEAGQAPWPPPAAPMQQERGGQSPGHPETEVKVVVVGDGGCGKTSLLLAFARGDFPKVLVSMSPGASAPVGPGWWWGGVTIPDGSPRRPRLAAARGEGQQKGGHGTGTAVAMGTFTAGHGDGGDWGWGWPSLGLTGVWGNLGGGSAPLCLAWGVTGWGAGSVPQ